MAEPPQLLMTYYLIKLTQHICRQGKCKEWCCSALCLHDKQIFSSQKMQLFTEPLLEKNIQKSHNNFKVNMLIGVLTEPPVWITFAEGRPSQTQGVFLEYSTVSVHFAVFTSWRNIPYFPDYRPPGFPTEPSGLYRGAVSLRSSLHPLGGAFARSAITRQPWI